MSCCARFLTDIPSTKLTGDVCWDSCDVIQGMHRKSVSYRRKFTRKANKKNPLNFSVVFFIGFFVVGFSHGIYARPVPYGQPCRVNRFGLPHSGDRVRSTDGKSSVFSRSRTRTLRRLSTDRDYERVYDEYHQSNIAMGSSYNNSMLFMQATRQNNLVLLCY